MEKFENDFRRFKPALERQVQSWFWINPDWRDYISRLDGLARVELNKINVDLNCMSEFFVFKYVKDFKKFCDALVEWLKPYLKTFTELIGYGGYAYNLMIRHGSKRFEKGVVIT